MLISIVGPTAVGKTGLAIALAQTFGAEIVSADSRQFYRGIPIGTAQPTVAERAQAPHHFVDFLSLEQEYSSGRFAADAVPWIEEYFRIRTERGRSPLCILVGGSGLYTQAVQDGLDDIPSNPAVRAELNDLHASSGLGPLLEELEKRDPDHRAIVDPSNPHRVIRALEVCRVSGQTYTSFRQQQVDLRRVHPGGWSRSRNRGWDTLTLGLNGPRNWLHDRINRRTANMIEAGWLEEAKAVLHLKEANALRTVGYPQLFDVLEGHMELDDAILRIQEATRQFARRQLTWFHRQSGVHWVDARYPDRAVGLVRDFMQHGHV